MNQPVQIYAASSVDGYLAPVDGSVGWLEEFEVEGIDLGFDDFYRSVGSVISGRVTYDQVLTFGEWPYKGKPVVVLSSQRPSESMPAGVRWDAGSDLPSLVAQLRDENEGNVWLLGGGALHHAFLQADLVDEIWTHIIPIMLGDGIRMFPPTFDKRRVASIETRTYANSVTMLRYAVRGSATG